MYTVRKSTVSVLISVSASTYDVPIFASSNRMKMKRKIFTYIHGAVTEAAPKVFLKYFYVNTKTGEKSGEMLATVKLG